MQAVGQSDYFIDVTTGTTFYGEESGFCLGDDY